MTPIPGMSIESPGEGYEYQGVGTCRGCRATVYWFITPKGKRSPHDADGVSHFATCPRAQRFRK